MRFILRKITTQVIIIITSSNPTNLGLAVSCATSFLIKLSHQVISVAAEYIAKGYILSDSILQRAIDLDSRLRLLQSQSQHNKSVEQHGISQKFLNYFQSMDKTIGERALGPQQTFSAKVQATVGQATQQARAMDQKKGYSKTATDVRYSLFRSRHSLIHVS